MFIKKRINAPRRTLLVITGLTILPVSKKKKNRTMDNGRDGPAVRKTRKPLNILDPQEAI